MTEAGVPVVPGYHGDNQDPEFLYEKAKECGFPIMLKAVLGGGGKVRRFCLLGFLRISGHENCVE
jgi:3-methylcrotonyl-CoA carboxylase alpha subunit